MIEGLDDQDKAKLIALVDSSLELSADEKALMTRKITNTPPISIIRGWMVAEIRIRTANNRSGDFLMVRSGISKECLESVLISDQEISNMMALSMCEAIYQYRERVRPQGRIKE